MGYDNPTPWRIGNRVRNGGTYILNSEGSAVAYIPHHKDALLIVEAVNGHDKEGSMQRKEAREVQEQG